MHRISLPFDVNIPPLFELLALFVYYYYPLIPILYT